MNKPPDIRWQQRFQNFDRALKRLAKALVDGPGVLSELEQEGAVQRFEYTYELGWKTLKDFLEFSGVTINPITPKQVFKSAYAAKLIESEVDWIDMLNHRNLLAHDYDEEKFEEALQAVHDNYLPALTNLRNRLNREFNDAS